MISSQKEKHKLKQKRWLFRRRAGIKRIRLNPDSKYHHRTQLGVSFSGRSYYCISFFRFQLDFSFFLIIQKREKKGTRRRKHKHQQEGGEVRRRMSHLEGRFQQGTDALLFCHFLYGHRCPSPILLLKSCVPATCQFCRFSSLKKEKGK